MYKFGKIYKNENSGSQWIAISIDPATKTLIPLIGFTELKEEGNSLAEIRVKQYTVDYRGKQDSWQEQGYYRPVLTRQLNYPVVNMLASTENALEMLLFAKDTRLTLGGGEFDNIVDLPENEKSEKLEYIANTIPSSWEFVQLNFEIKNVSRIFTHQLVRTRTASYAQQTQRAIKFSEIDYMIPEGVLERGLVGKIDSIIQQQFEMYERLIGSGISTSDARFVFPQSCTSNILMSINMRNFANMVKSRQSSRVAVEYRYVLQQMVDAAVKRYPWMAVFVNNQVLEKYKQIDDWINTTGLPDTLEIVKALDYIKNHSH